jgi:hypothetical protein
MMLYRDGKMRSSCCSCLTCQHVIARLLYCCSRVMCVGRSRAKVIVNDVDCWQPPPALLFGCLFGGPGAPHHQITNAISICVTCSNFRLPVFNSINTKSSDTAVSQGSSTFLPFINNDNTRTCASTPKLFSTCTQTDSNHVRTWLFSRGS